MNTQTNPNQTLKRKLKRLSRIGFRIDLFVTDECAPVDYEIDNEHLFVILSTNSFYYAELRQHGEFFEGEIYCFDHFKEAINNLNLKDMENAEC